MNEDELNIRDWIPEEKSLFRELNMGWLMHYFSIEPIDEFVLFDPEKAIIEQGGAILMAELNGEIVGTVALRKQSPGIFELTKMTIREDRRGQGYGERLCLGAIKKACDMRIQKLVLYSHSKLPEAIPLYHKLGFREVPKEDDVYARCDIKMEMEIDRPMIIPAKPLHAPLLSQIGGSSFADAFGMHFISKPDLLNYLDATYSSSRIAASLCKPNNVFFLAYLNGLAIGFIKLKKRSLNKLIDEEKQTELQKIYVLTPYHGMKIANELMNSGLRMAESLGSKLVWLDVIIENKKAIRFYHKFGFKRIGHHEFQIGSQLFHYHVMIKQLHENNICRSINGELQQQ